MRRPRAMAPGGSSASPPRLFIHSNSPHSQADPNTTAPLCPALARAAAITPSRSAAARHTGAAT